MYDKHGALSVSINLYACWGGRKECAMDKRILKTKKGLKDALRALLVEKTFEEITVTEICSKARTGRLTFYKYFADKEDLLLACLTDIENRIEEEYLKGKDSRRRAWEDIPVKTERQYLRLQLESFCDDVLSAFGPDMRETVGFMSNSGMLAHFSEFATKYFEKMEWEEYRSEVSQKLPEQGSGDEKKFPGYPARRLNAFLAMGIWGYLAAPGENPDAARIRSDIKGIIKTLVDSGMFDRKG